VDQLTSLMTDRLNQARVAMTQRTHRDAHAEIEVAFAGIVPKPTALTTHRHKRKPPIGGKNMVRVTFRCGHEFAGKGEA
jgi:hypothetical protein